MGEISAQIPYQKDTHMYVSIGKILNMSVHYGIQVEISMKPHSITIVIGKGKKRQ